MKYFQCLTEVTATRQKKNEDEGRREASTVVTVGRGGPGLLMRGQRARDEEGFLLPLLCSGFKAVAARAGSGSHLQNEVEDAGWDGARESGGRLGHRVDSRDESRISSWWLLLLESLS